LVVFQNEGDGVFQENDSLDQILDIQLLEDLIPALLDILVEGPVQITLESLYCGVGEVLQEME
jgi:hypothetical protein